MLNQTQDPVSEILTVEDSPYIQYTISSSLAIAGYKVDSVSNGQLAIQFVGQKKGLYRALLLDLLMPFSDGKKTIKKIRSMTGDKAKTLIMAVTANHDNYNIKNFKELGFNGVLIKPVHCIRLIKMLQSLLIPLPNPKMWIGLLDNRGVLHKDPAEDTLIAKEES